MDTIEMIGEALCRCVYRSGTESLIWLRKGLTLLTKSVHTVRAELNTTAEDSELSWIFHSAS